MSLALMYLFKEEILQIETDDLPGFMKSFIRDNVENFDNKELFETLLSFKVSNRLLKTLEMLHDHSSPSHVILTQNPNMKLDWKILPEDFNASTDPSTIQTE